GFQFHLRQILSPRDQQLLQLLDPRRAGKVPWVNMMLDAKFGGYGHRLAVVGAGSHHSSGSKSYVAGTNEPSTQKQIFNMLTVHGAIRNLIHSFGMPLRTAGLLAVHPIGRM